VKLDEQTHGPCGYRSGVLAAPADGAQQMVGARYLGPGRLRSALRGAVDEGGATRVSRNTYGPPDRGNAPRGRGSSPG
jgi:hypothetical protein